jgi:hypothetical protein
MQAFMNQGGINKQKKAMRQFLGASGGFYEVSL